MDTDQSNANQNTTEVTRSATKAKTSPMKRNEIVIAYAFLAPALICLSVFVFYPMIYAFFVSLHRWDALSPMQYIGFNNYTMLFRNPEFRRTLIRTFQYVVMYVPVLFVISLSLALIVKHVRVLSGLFRTVFFFPIVMASVVVGLVWNLMLDDRLGLFNIILRTFGLGPVHWLSSVNLSLPSAAMVHVWMQMGFFMIIFLAGLQDIPRDYYEAAHLDGANGPQVFRYITMPCLKNASIFVLIMSVIGSFQAFDHINMLTGGGPARSSRIAVQHIWEQGFRVHEMGMAAAMSFVLFIIIVIFTIIQLVVVKTNKE